MIVAVLAFAKAEFSQAQPYHQDLPPITQKSAPSINEVTRIQEATYKADSTGHEPLMQHVYNYNDNGLLFQDYRRIYGKYGSETLDSYHYTGTRLDSMETMASAQNFNSISKYSHDSNGRIIKEVSTGVYANYERDYSYDDQGRVSKIVMNHQTGNKITTLFFYNGKLLDRVEQRDGKNIQEEKLEYTFYHNEKPFAYYEDGDQTLTVYQTNRGTQSDKIVVKNVITSVEKLRNAMTDDTKFQEEFTKLMPGATVIHQTFDATETTSGEWIKRYDYKDQYGRETKSYVFRKLYFKDGSTVGSTDFNDLFVNRYNRS
jgi:hypothetical protein